MASIYLIQSRTSGKSYIGQTKTTTEKRWKRHLSDMQRRSGCSALYAAIRKYGADDFSVKTLQIGDFSREQLNELEQQYIKDFSTFSPLGYNLTTGGDCNKVSDETRKRKSERMKGRQVTWGDKVSIGVKKLWENPEYRAKQVRQRHEKRGKYRKGIKRDGNRVKISLADFRSDYESGMKIKDIMTKYKISCPTIYKIIKEYNICKRRV